MSSRESSKRSSRSPKKGEDNTFLFVIGTVAVIIVGYAVYKNLFKDKHPTDTTKENYDDKCQCCK